MKKEKQKINRKEHYEYERKLTVKQISERGDDLAKAWEDKQSIDNKAKEVSSGYKRQAQEHMNQINKLTQEIRSGKEVIADTCDVEYDFDKGIKTYKDEGKVVGTEKMDDLDYQLRTDDGPDLDPEDEEDQEESDD